MKAGDTRICPSYYLPEEAPAGPIDTLTVSDRGGSISARWGIESDVGDQSVDCFADELDALGRFRNWLQEKVDNDATGHSYSRRMANQHFARAKDVDRQFIDEYDQFSTVLITYDRPRPVGESIPRHTSRFYPRSVTGKRRRLLKDLDVYDEYAGVSVLAPKHGPDGGDEPPEYRVPHLNAQTHAHDFLWMPGAVPESDFEEIRSVTDADIHVSVETHQSSDVTTPGSVADRGGNLDAVRGETTSLPQELGENLPLLQTKLDARGLPEYAEYWCARMRLGSDDSLETSGERRFRTHGRFSELADARKLERWIREGVRVGSELARRFDRKGTVLQ